MPVMDGISCVKRIRELLEERRIMGHVPVIAVTLMRGRIRLLSAWALGW
jgi:CheY-like chemotaxis protein